MSRYKEVEKDDFYKENSIVVLLQDSRNFKTIRSRKLSDRERLDEINAKINSTYGSDLDDYDKAYIAMMSSRSTVYDVIEEI